MGGDFLASRLGRWLEHMRTGRPPVPQFDWSRGTGESLLLHVGCGSARKQHLRGFSGEDWREIRLDADASAEPDILGTMTDLSAVPDAAVDAIFSSHGIEHLYWHEVPVALAEFHRVLAPQGFLLVTCPDLQAAAAMIAEDRVFDPAYESAAGTITPFDIVFSYRPFVARNPRWMAHHCGFTLSVLDAVLAEAGFVSRFGGRRPAAFDLWMLASKVQRSEEEWKAISARYFPPAA